MIDAIEDIRRKAEAMKVLSHDPTVTLHSDDVLALISEIDRCHARLEIDHVYRLVDGKGVHESVPYTDRRTVPDGITCRDATINLLEGMIRRAKR